MSKTKSDKTVTRSFRISEAAFNALQEDAKRQHISTNTLLNQILTNYANSDRFFARLGDFRIAKATYTHLLNAASDADLIEAARLSGRDTSESIILAKHGTLSLTTVIDYLRMVTEFGGYADYNEVDSQGKRVITLIHNLGRKGSVYFSSYVESLFGLIGRQPKITLSENAIAVEI